MPELEQFSDNDRLDTVRIPMESPMSTGLLSRLPLIVLGGWARSGTGRCVTGLATTG